MIESMLTGGGSAGLILALAYAYRQIRAARREHRLEPREQASAAMTNAETANSLLLASLKEEREEVSRLSGRVLELESQNGDLYEQLRNQRRQYEEDLAVLREQFNSVSSKLSALEARIKTTPEDMP